MALSCHPTTTSVPLTLAHPTVLIDSLSQSRQISAACERLWENNEQYFCCSILSESEEEKENGEIHAQYIQNGDIVRACGVP
jgi:hypothetical protein